MALITCPECNKEISDKALSCIGCGFPINPVFENNTESSTEKFSSPLSQANNLPSIKYKEPFSDNKNTEFSGSYQNNTPHVWSTVQSLGMTPQTQFLQNNRLEKNGGINVAKLIIGIISIVLSALIFYQSYYVRMAAAFSSIFGGNEDLSGFVGLIVAVLVLTAGIVGIVTRSARGGGITTGVLYVLASFIGLSSHGMFVDLIIYAVIVGIFGLIFIIGSVKTKAAKITIPIIIIFTPLLYFALTPSIIGFYQDNKLSGYIDQARTGMTAAQILFTEEAGRGSSREDALISVNNTIRNPSNENNRFKSFFGSDFEGNLNGFYSITLKDDSFSVDGLFYITEDDWIIQISSGEIEYWSPKSKIGSKGNVRPLLFENIP